MVNVTVNTRTLNTHTRTDWDRDEAKPQCEPTTRATSWRLINWTETESRTWGWARHETEQLTADSRERERSTAGTESKRAERWESAYLLCLCLPTFSAQCCCSCSLNEAVLPYASTHCSAGTIFTLGFDYLRSLRTVEQQTNNSHEGALVQYDNVIGVIDVRWSCAMWSTE